MQRQNDIQLSSMKTRTTVQSVAKLDYVGCEEMSSWFDVMMYKQALISAPGCVWVNGKGCWKIRPPISKFPVATAHGGGLR